MTDLVTDPKVGDVVVFNRDSWGMDEDLMTGEITARSDKRVRVRTEVGTLKTLRAAQVLFVSNRDFEATKEAVRSSTDILRHGVRQLREQHRTRVLRLARTGLEGGS
jgi:hypothetical protein